MASGNFILGRGLSLEGFNKYIKPNLEKYKTEITDFLCFKENGQEKIFASLVGNDGSLERIVKISLEEAVPIIEKDYEERTRSAGLPTLAYAHEIRGFDHGEYNFYFKTIGVYGDDETSSKVFQNLAIKYSAIDLQNTLKKTEEAISSFANKFK